MSTANPLPYCAGCGEPLGVYEPGVAMLPDGRLLDSSHTQRLTLPDATHYHPACAPDAGR